MINFIKRKVFGHLEMHPSVVTYNHTKDCVDDRKQACATSAGYFLLLPFTPKFFVCI